MLRRDLLKSILALPAFSLLKNKPAEDGIVKSEKSMLENHIGEAVLPSEPINYIPGDLTFDTNICSELKMELSISQQQYKKLIDYIGINDKFTIIFSDNSLMEFYGYIVEILPTEIYSFSCYSNLFSCTIKICCSNRDNHDKEIMPIYTNEDNNKKNKFTLIEFQDLKLLYTGKQ